MDYIAVKAHRSSYPNPICLEPGQKVALGRSESRYPGWIWVTSASGVKGWAPKSIIRVDAAGSGVATRAYTARELNTQVGERLSYVSELEGWAVGRERERTVRLDSQGDCQSHLTSGCSRRIGAVTQVSVLRGGPFG